MAVLFNAEGCTPGELSGIQSNTTKEYENIKGDVQSAFLGDEQKQFEAYMKLMAHTTKYLAASLKEALETPAVDIDKFEDEVELG